MVRTYKQKNRLCKNSKLSEKQIQRIITFYVALHTSSECSEKVGVSASTIKKYYIALGGRLDEIFCNDEFPNYHVDNLVFEPYLAFILTPLSKKMADISAPIVAYNDFLIYKKTGVYAGVASSATGKLRTPEYYKRMVFEHLEKISLKRKNITQKSFSLHLALARYRTLITACFSEFLYNKTLQKELGGEIIPKDFDPVAGAGAAGIGILLDSLIRRPLELK